MASADASASGPCDYGRGLVVCEGWLHKMRSSGVQKPRPKSSSTPSARYTATSQAAGPSDATDDAAIIVDDGPVVETSTPGFFQSLVVWQRRFVAIEGATLCYYRRKPELTAAGHVHAPEPSFRGDLRRALGVQLESSTSFNVAWDGKTLRLRATDARIAQRWVHTLRSHVDAWRSRAARATVTHPVAAPIAAVAGRRVAWSDPPASAAVETAGDADLSRTLSTAASYARMRPAAPSPTAASGAPGGDSGSSGSNATATQIRTHEVVETVAPEAASPETIVESSRKPRVSSSAPPPALDAVAHPAAVPVVAIPPSSVRGGTETATAEAMSASGGDLLNTMSHMSLAVVSTSRGGSAMYSAKRVGE